jgi:uncharacterized protein (DUF2147 family)
VAGRADRVTAAASLPLTARRGLNRYHIRKQSTSRQRTAHIVARRSAASALAQDRGILGVWATDKGKGHIDIVKCAQPEQGLYSDGFFVATGDDIGER